MGVGFVAVGVGLFGVVPVFGVVTLVGVDLLAAVIGRCSILAAVDPLHADHERQHPRDRHGGDAYPVHGRSALHPLAEQQDDEERDSRQQWDQVCVFEHWWCLSRASSRVLRR